MRKIWILSAIFCAGFITFTTFVPERAEARCKTFTASHNGTDMFYDDGAKGTAKNKLYWQVEQWRKENGIKRVRFGKVRTSCGEWFMKYLLMHKNCKAKARVCY